MPHGGGSCFFMDWTMGSPDTWEPLRGWLAGVLTWPVPGARALAERAGRLLDQAGIAWAADSDRGCDHGVFVPLKVVAAQASVPTLQLSLQRGPDPAAHLALAPLRDEGVLINMGLFGHPKAPELSVACDRWLGQAVTGAAARANPRRGASKTR
jgi:hypothetical protein